MAMTEADRKEFRELITEGNNSLKEIFKATLDPIQKDVDCHTETIKEVPIIKQRVDDHLQNHTAETQKQRFNFEMWIIVAIFAVDKILQYFPPTP